MRRTELARSAALPEPLDRGAPFPEAVPWEPAAPAWPSIHPLPLDSPGASGTGLADRVLDGVLGTWERLGLVARVRRPILLMLHQVTDPRWLRSFGIEVRRLWRPIGLGEFVERHATGTLARDHVAVTFDDGFRSIRTIVEPVLGGLGIPFTTFVCGGVLEGGEIPWFYRAMALLRRHPATSLAPFWGLPEAAGSSETVLLDALKPAPRPRLLDGLERAEAALGGRPEDLRDEFLGADDVAALARNPLVTIGGHTLSHPILSVLGETEQDREIGRGREVLAGILGTAPRVFAYPNGKRLDFDERTTALVRRHGFVGAVTSIQRPVAPGDDPMQLPRFGVSEGDTIQFIRLKRAIPVPGRGEQAEVRTRRRFARVWRGQA